MVPILEAVEEVGNLKAKDVASHNLRTLAFFKRFDARDGAQFSDPFRPL